MGQVPPATHTTSSFAHLFSALARSQGLKGARRLDSVGPYRSEVRHLDRLGGTGGHVTSLCLGCSRSVRNQSLAQVTIAALANTSTIPAGDSGLDAASVCGLQREPTGPLYFPWRYSEHSRHGFPGAPLQRESEAWMAGSLVLQMGSRCL